MIVIPSGKRPIYWATEINGEIAQAGINPIGQVTVTKHTVIQDENENIFLEETQGKAVEYNPLPEIGEPCEGNTIYGDGQDLVICRRNHKREAFAAEEDPLNFMVYRALGIGTPTWVPNELVTVGTERFYANAVYAAIQDHETSPDLKPKDSPEHWELTQDVDPAQWLPRTYYNEGSLVLWTNDSYVALVDHTSQSGGQPPNEPDLWELAEENARGQGN